MILPSFTVFTLAANFSVVDSDAGPLEHHRERRGKGQIGAANQVGKALWVETSDHLDSASQLSHQGVL